MAISVEWGNPQRTFLRFHINAVSDWSEFESAVDTANEMMQSVNHPVDLVVSSAPGVVPPRGALNRFQSVQNRRPANQRLTIIVGAGPYAVIGKVLSRVSRQFARDVKFVNTLEEAYAVLAEIQESSG